MKFQPFKARKKEVKKHNSLSPNVLGFTVAATVGAALGILFAPKKGEQMREDVLKKAKRIALQFQESREEIQAKIKETFGEVNEDLERAYLELKSHILAASEEFKGKATFTQQKYNEIVQSVVKNISEDKKWSKNLVSNFVKLFLKDYLLPAKSVKKQGKKKVSKSEPQKKAKTMKKSKSVKKNTTKKQKSSKISPTKSSSQSKNKK